MHHTSTCQATNIVFAVSPVVSGGYDARADTVADFNNDGLADLLVNNTDAQSMEVKLSKGNGTFASVLVPGPYNAFSRSGGFAAGDANGDGYPDVIYTAPADGRSSYGLGVALSNGDGTFQSAKVYSLSNNGPLGFLFPVDLNNDGRADLITATTDGSSFVLMNKGDGSFGVAQQLDAGILAVPHGLGAADFNGDGKMDIVATNGSGICALIGKGDGTLTRSNETCANGPNTGYTRALMVGDLDGDGKPDVVAAKSSENSVFGATLYLNNGKGGFSTGVGLEVASLSTDGQLADLDNDGKLDLILFTTGNLAQVYTGLGDGYFATTPTLLGLGESNGGPLLVGDFLGQGLQGLAAFNSSSGGFDVLGSACRTGALPAPAPLIPGSPVQSKCAPEKVSVGAPSFLSATYSRDDNIPDYGVVALDLNGDGKTDLLKGGGPSGAAFQYFLSTGNGTFSAAKSAGSADGFGGLAAGDLNGDGFPDVVYSLRSTNNSSNPKQVAVALNTGRGTFSAPTAYSLNGSQTPNYLNFGTLVLADLNNDGKLDLVADNLVALGRGDGSFVGLGYPVSNRFSLYVGPFRVVDVNGDQQLDIISVSPASGNPTQEKPGYCVALNTGRAQFAPPTCTQAAVNPLGLDVGDVNGDGKMDLVLADYGTTQALDVLLGNGDGTFGAVRSFEISDAGASSVALADENNDGKLDAYLWRGGSPGQVTLFQGNGDGTFTRASTVDASSGNAGITQILVGDFAGNGLPGYAVLNLADPSHPGLSVATAACQP